MDLKRGIDKAVEVVVAELKKISKHLLNFLPPPVNPQVKVKIKHKPAKEKGYWEGENKDNNKREYVIQHIGNKLGRQFYQKINRAD